MSSTRERLAWEPSGTADVPEEGAERNRDVLAMFVLAGAVLLSVGSCVLTAASGTTLAYSDAVSHLLISRRVWDASTAGAAQLGGVWLPLPHLLAVPFVIPDPWYYSGIGGCVIPMLSYVAATGWLYRVGTDLAENRAAGATAAAVFATNPNVLYLQSTPMTELPLLACAAGTARYLVRWYRTGDFRHLIATAFMVLLGTLVRYEGWVLLATVTVVVGVGSWQRHRGRSEAWVRCRADLVVFGVLATSGVVGWLTWNLLIFGDPLYFVNGTFGESELWVDTEEKAVGSWATALSSYLHAVGGVLGPVTSVAGLAGLAWQVVRTRARFDVVVPLSLLAFLPFFVVMLYSGRRPMHVPPIHDGFYNVRFGLILVVPVALGFGFLAGPRTTTSRWRRLSLLVVPLGAVASSLVLLAGGVVTLDEPVAVRASGVERADAAGAAWLRAHYDHGRVLMQSWRNETVSFDSRVPPGNVIYEGSFRQWRPALRNPEGMHVRWIHMARSRGEPDDVWRSLHASSRLRAYRLVYRDARRLVYRRRDEPAGVPAAVLVPPALRLGDVPPDHTWIPRTKKAHR